MTFDNIPYLKKILSYNKSHLIFICLALVLSVAIMSAQRFFNTTLINELQYTSASLLTADLEIASTRPLDMKRIQVIENGLPKFKYADRQILSTMAQFNQNQDSKLVELVAISSLYPLRGDCMAEDKNGQLWPVSKLLATHPNAVVIASELQIQFNLNINETLSIGEFQGTIVGIINSEPDINVQSLALGPRVYTFLDNRQKTGFDYTLSRVYHSRFYSFDDLNAIDAITRSIETQLQVSSKDKSIQGAYGPSQPIVVRSFLDLSETIIEGFDKLNEFYLFLSLFTLILCAAAFAFIIWAHIISQLQHIGNLRFLGVSAKKINHHYLNQSFILAVIITIGGILFGAMISQIVYNMVATISNFQTTIIDIAFMDILYISFFTLSIILGITVFVLKLLNTPLQMDHFKFEQRSSSTSAILFLVFSLVIVFILVFLKINALSWTMIGIICLLFIIILGVLLLIDYIVFPLFKYFYNTSLPIHVRLAMKCLSQSHTLRRLSFISIALSLMTILSIAHYEHALEKEFNPESSASTMPTLFILDLYGHQRQSFDDFVSVPTYLAPMIQGRITHVNSMSVNQYAKTLNNDFFLYREQNLSTRFEQALSEIIVKGEWFNLKDDVIEASIEERFAKRLGLSLGDRLQFSILNQPLIVTITSVRRVNWGSFNPNFFILIEPPYLDSFPQTWIGSIFADTQTEMTATQQFLTAQMPNVTIINIKETSQKVFAFLKTFLLSIKVGSLMCFLIGVILFLLLSKLYRDYRKDSFAMLYWIGLSKQKIQRITFIEQICFIVVTFLISVLVSIILIKILCSTVIGIPFYINLPVVCYVGILLVFSTTLFSWFSKDN